MPLMSKVDANSFRTEECTHETVFKAFELSLVNRYVSVGSNCQNPCGKTVQIDRHVYGLVVGKVPLCTRCFFARAEGHKAQSLGKSCHLTVLLLNLDEEIEDMCLDRLRGTDLTGDT
jgi:hypothetical protein